MMRFINLFFFLKKKKNHKVQEKTALLFPWVQAELHGVQAFPHEDHDRDPTEDAPRCQLFEVLHSFASENIWIARVLFKIY